MKKMYIARKFVPIDEYGAKAYYEESIFDSYDEAQKFVQEISEEDSDDFLTEIVSYNVGSYESHEDEQIWYFDRKGNLICKDFTGSSKAHEEVYMGKFEVGDIVFIRAYPWNQFSHCFLDIIGVIFSCPIPLSDWLSKGKNSRDWDNCYIVNYISSSGYLDHDHFRERGIELFNNQLPEEFEFLNILSNHLKGKCKIKKDVLKDVLNSNVFVKKVRMLNPLSLPKIPSNLRNRR